MSEDNFKKIERKKLPWFYRLILKFPGVNFLESSSGVFWGVVVPVFLSLELFLNIFLLLYFPFPINIVLVSIIPVAVFIVFVRISLERFMNWWNNVVAKSGFEWNIEKSVEEYVKLLKKKNE